MALANRQQAQADRLARLTSRDLEFLRIAGKCADAGAGLNWDSLNADEKQPVLDLRECGLLEKHPYGGYRPTAAGRDIIKAMPVPA